jgi:hypothetical protein
MYFFVMGNLSGRQQGIQAGHAAVEYSLRCGLGEKEFGDYVEFAQHHKTFILLDGGGSNDMYDRLVDLTGLGIPHAKFNEPDLNNAVSAIAFILAHDVYSIDLNAPGVEGDTDYAHRYAIKSYVSKFRLASN